MRDLCSTNRRKIYGKDVKYFNVPQYEGLTIKDFLEYSDMYPEVMKALPIERKEIFKLPRQYIINVVNTIVGEPFVKWVQKRVDERHKKVADDTQPFIDFDAEIAEIYKNSNAVSGK